MYNPTKGNIISAANSTTVLLTGGATFTGVWEKVIGYTMIAVAIKSQNATDGTLWMDVSQDGGATIINSVPFTVSDTTFFVPKPWNVVETHFRVRYVNGTTAQTGWWGLQTKYSNGQESDMLGVASDTIRPEDAVSITKAIETGTDPNNNYQNGVVSGVSDVNSTTSTLGAGAAFTGGWTPLSGFHGITCLVDGTSGGVSDGTLEMQFSTDGGVTIHRNISIPVADITNAPPRTLGTVGSHFRIVYTNGSTPTTSTNIQTMLHTEQVNLVGRLDSNITPNTDIALVRSINAGQKPDGSFQNDPHNGVCISTSANLGISGVFTSDWIDTDGYNSIELFITSDVISADRGIDIQFTDDLSGTPVNREDHFYSYTDIDIDRGYLEIAFPPRMVGFRIVYTNGLVAQTSFLMQSDLKINGENNRYNTGGALITGDFKSEVALGRVPNYIQDTKFGLVKNLDAADAESTIWEAANDDGVNQLARKTFPTATGTLHMASTNVGDTAEITICYHDANNNVKYVSANLTGQTPVSLGVTALDANVAYISGTDETLAGSVFISLNSSYTLGVPTTLSDTIAYISQASGRTAQATFRVPANSRLLMNHVYITATRANGSASSAVVYLRYKPAGGSWYVLRPYILTTSNIINKSESLVFNAGDFIEFTVDEVSDADTSFSSIFEYELVQV